MRKQTGINSYICIANYDDASRKSNPKNDNKLCGEKVMIKENDRVKTLVEKEGFPVGTMGVVVSVYSEGPQCEVEVWDADEYPVDVVTYSFDEIEGVEE